MQQRRVSRLWRLPIILLLAGRQVGPDPLVQINQPPIPSSQIQEGELLFRRGRSLASRFVLSMDSHSDYSHVGILIFQRGEPFVVHAEPAGDRGGAGATVAEPLAKFLAPEQATAWALYRVRPGLETVASAAARRAEAYAQAATPFDPAFNLDSSDKVYCTELVWRCYLEAGLDLTEAKRDRVQLPFFQKEVLLPSSLLRSRLLILVERDLNSGDYKYE